MILINTSEVIASLLPEVYHTLDPDTPCTGDLTLTVQRYIKHLILQAFFHRVVGEFYFEEEWLVRLRRDRSLIHLSDRNWIDVEVVDQDGTYILIIEEG